MNPLEMFSLEGRKVLLLGAVQGIGKCVALIFVINVMSVFTEGRGEDESFSPESKPLMNL